MKWEHKEVKKDDVSVEAFDSLGSLGWQLVAFDKWGNAWFKRAYGSES